LRPGWTRSIGRFQIDLVTLPNPAAESQVQHPWRVLGGVWALYGAFGLLMGSTGALVPLIRNDLGLSRTQMGLVLGAWQLAYIGSSIPCGRLIDKIGLRRSLGISIAVMVLSAILRSSATGFWSLLLFVALFGIGAPIVSIAAPKTASVLFDGADRRRAVGIYGTAPAVGGALVAPFVGDSWRAVTLIFAAVAAASGAFWIWASRDLRSASELVTTSPATVADLVRLPVVRALLILAVVAFMFTHGLGQWMVDLLQSNEGPGRSVGAAGYWTSAGSVMGLLATLIIPRFAIPGRRVPILVVMLGAGAAGTGLLLTASDWWLAAPLAASTIARVAIMPVSMLILMDHTDVGPANMAGASALFFTAAQVGGVTGPLITGLMADTSAGFQGALFVHASLMVALAIFVATVIPRWIVRR